MMIFLLGILLSLLALAFWFQSRLEKAKREYMEALDKVLCHPGESLYRIQALDKGRLYMSIRHRTWLGGIYAELYVRNDLDVRLP